MDKVRKAGKMERFSVKLLATIMLCILGVVIVIGGFLMIEQYDAGIFDSNQYSYYKTSDIHHKSFIYARDAICEYVTSDSVQESGQKNYAYVISYKADGQEMKEVYSFNYSPSAKYGFHQHWEGGIAYEILNIPQSMSFEELQRYEIDFYVADPIQQYDDEFYDGASYFEFLYSNRYLIIGLTIAAALLFLIDLVWLIYSSGHDVHYEGYHLNWVDTIPLDVVTCIYGAIAGLFGILAMNLSFDFYYNFRQPLFLICIFATLIISGLCILGWIITFAKRCKVGRWWENTVIYMILKFIVNYVQGIRMIWKAIIVVAVYFVLNTYVLFDYPYYKTRLVFTILHGLLLAGVLWWLSNAQKIKDHTEKISKGDYETIDSKYMSFDLKEHLRNIDSIQDGLETAVEKHLKAERLKTELITNVSHDIRTPLTSIINYVDLLQKEHTPEEEAKYLEVLDRQSQRLKKMTDDLIEASKASTGNIAANLTRINVREIIDQSLAEYSEKFEMSGLEIITSITDDNMTVMADGTLLWRILNNLYSNINKYAMPNTRVYIDAVEEDNDVLISVKNISKDQLNISSEELMERFVRGDSSRHTEGSGLGLNIARSLAEIMNGSLNLVIDGDLFKIELRLPK